MLGTIIAITTKMKVTRIVIPATRALSAATVFSAKKARLVGKPNPKETPSKTAEKNEKTEPKDSAKIIVDRTPRVIHSHTNFFGSASLATKIPTTAETTAET
ncbi:MAG: hypothetical protein ABSE15_03365 [Candidatus Bathyarchaeia archaeon]